MADTWNNAARARDVSTMELVEQILRGSGASSAAHQQRSMSSGRHPRLGASATLQGQLLAAAGASVAAGGDSGAATNGRSPRPRSASVGRRQQDMQELANVVQALQTKGRVIQSISSILQELPEGPTSLRPGGGAAGAANAAPGGPGMGGGGSHSGGAPTSTAVAATAMPNVLDGRAYGGNSVVAGSNAASGAGVPRSRGAAGSSSSVAGKGVARSILGGVETLTSKLELLGDRLTPRKGSPRAERPRESSNGRRHATVSADGGGPNFRDLLAAANAGLLQGHGLLDTMQGSRDQRPTAAPVAGGVGASGGGQGMQSTYGGQGMQSTYGASGLRGAGVGGSLYGSAMGAELAASMIMQNRHRTSEDLLAADRLLQNLHAEIRGASGGGAAVGTTAASAGENQATLAPHPPSYAPAQPPHNQALRGADRVSADLIAAPAGSAGAAGAAAAGAGGSGGNLVSMNSGNPGSSGDAPARPGVGTRRRGGSAAAGVEGGGMLQSFLATLSEAVPPPQTPMSRSGPGSGVDATPARPVEEASPRHGGYPSYVGGGGGGGSVGGPELHPERSESQRANHQSRPPHQSPRNKHLQPQQRSPNAHLLMRTSAPDFMGVLSGAGGRASGGYHASGAERERERATAGGASTVSMSGVELGAELEQRLSALQRTAAVAMARGGAALEPESSLGSAGAATNNAAGGAAAGVAAGSGAAAAVNVEAWLQSIGRSDRRDRDREQRIVAAAGPTTSGSSLRDSALAGTTAGLAGPPSARQRATAWADESPMAATAAAAAGSALVASTAGAVAVGGMHGTSASYATATGGLSSARSEGKSAGPSGGDAVGGGVGPATLRDILPAGHLPLASHATASQAAAVPVANISAAWQDSDGLNLALLMQQRKKERARREEQEAADAAVAATRARQHASDWQAQHDMLMTRYLAVRQRLEALEAEQERVAKEGCGSCARRKDQLQQVSDTAANTAAQLREVQAQLQEARAREEAVRRQLEHTAATASDQAAAGARQRTSFELALQEFVDLAEAAAAAASLPGVTPSCSSSIRAGSGEGSASASAVGSRHHAAGTDLEGLMEALRSRLREQGELARRQREMLDAAQEKLMEERSAAAVARDAASSERAGSLALATQEAGFQRERAEALQEELARQRDITAKLEMRLRHIEDERDRVARQRDAAELSLQAQQAQLEAAQQQQETLVGRLYDGQRAREDAEVLQAQIRSLGRQLEETRAAAARSDALERKAAVEREAREELDGQLAALQSQLAERESALEGARRRVRELEAAANSAVASRQVALDQVNSRADEVRTLTAENARMFHLLDRLQQEKRAADAQVQDLAVQLASLQQEAASLRSDLTAARDQLAAAKSSNTVMDATLAQHQLAADLAAARSEAAALRTAHEAASEYAQLMARSLRRHGLTVPEPPTAADVTSQIATLQAKFAAESDALAAARAEASEVRQQLSDARLEMERLKREVQSLTERYAQMEAAHAASQQSWQLAAHRDAATLNEVSRERDALRLELHTLQVAGTQDGDEMRRKVARLEVQVEALGSSKREAEERARLLAADLGVLRKELADRETKMEAMKLSLEDAKEGAERAAKLQHQAEAQAEEAGRALAAALADADKARAAAAVEAERARAAALREVERARAAARAEMEKALEAAQAEAEKARVEADAERARAKKAVAVQAKKAAEEAEKARAAGAAEAEEGRAAVAEELEKQLAEVKRLQSEVERLEKELADRNAEYAGLYDYCGGVIGERDSAVEERDSFAAAAAAAAAEVAALRREVEELREELADKEQRLAVKPKMAELQYRINELSAQLAEVTAERDAAVAESNQTAQKLQDETEAHFQTDGRRVRLGEEVERLRGILRMYSIPF